MNAEICLGTIKNLKTAINWLKSTFLFARIKKNPEYYGFSPELKYKIANKYTANNPSIIDDYLTKLLIKNLLDLNEVTLVNTCDFHNLNAVIKPTKNGRLMMRYCIAFDTMKLIILNLDPQFIGQSSSTGTCTSMNSNLNGTKSLEDLVRSYLYFLY